MTGPRCRWPRNLSSCRNASGAPKHLFHITFAIARFFEILLFDIARSIAGLVALGLVIVLGCIGGVAGVRKLGRKFMK